MTRRKKMSPVITNVEEVELHPKEDGRRTWEVLIYCTDDGHFDLPANTVELTDARVTWRDGETSGWSDRYCVADYYDNPTDIVVWNDYIGDRWPGGDRP